jgi:hypothetical protein
MWTEEQWAKRKRVADEEKARRRAVAHRRADMFEARGKAPPTGGSQLRRGPKGGGAHCTDAEVARVMMLRENARRSSEAARAARGDAVADGEDTKAVVHVPEVVQPGETQAPADPFPTPCPGCERGEPHRNDKGQLQKGHTLSTRGRRPGSKNNATKLAIQAMQGAANKAAQRLIRGIDSNNEWVATACAKTIVERTIPPDVLVDPNLGQPMIVFPPGAKIDVKLRSGDGPAAALPATVPGAGEPREPRQ